MIVGTLGINQLAKLDKKSAERNENIVAIASSNPLDSFQVQEMDCEHKNS